MMLLFSAGKVSHEEALAYVRHEYEDYTIRMLKAEKSEDDYELEKLISDAELLFKSKSEK